jgi:hypothetical protein
VFPKRHLADKKKIVPDWQKFKRIDRKLLVFSTDVQMTISHIGHVWITTNIFNPQNFDPSKILSELTINLVQNSMENELLNSK